MSHIPANCVVITRTDYDDFKNLERLYLDLKAKEDLHREQDHAAVGLARTRQARFLTRDGLIAYGSIPGTYPTIYLPLTTDVHAFMSDDPMALTPSERREYRLTGNCMRSGCPIYQEQ